MPGGLGPVFSRSPSREEHPTGLPWRHIVENSRLTKRWRWVRRSDWRRPNPRWVSIPRLGVIQAFWGPVARRVAISGLEEPSQVRRVAISGLRGGWPSQGGHPIGGARPEPSFCGSARDLPYFLVEISRGVGVDSPDGVAIGRQGWTGGAHTGCGNEHVS